MLNEYSGGMRRRRDLAAGLVARPPVLFLDEPTTGLEPTSRVRMWGVTRLGAVVGRVDRRVRAAGQPPLPAADHRLTATDRRAPGKAARRAG
jgi:ABC-type uncharacterized transport system YnjBCD ATPase subunit